VRVAACEAWSRRGGPEAVHALSKVLHGDTELDVRLAAARALGALRDRTAIPALGLALEDANPALQWRAIQSLKAVSGRDFGDNVPAWRQFVQSGAAPEREHPSLADRVRDLF
jgi:HEAT repeat protein